MRVVIERLGYPLYFLVILGVWKLLGAVALVIPRFPRLKEWAYAGVVFNLTGALVSHVASGDIEPGPMSYLVVMVGITATSWSLRPPSRRNFPYLRSMRAGDGLGAGTRRFPRSHSRRVTSRWPV